MNISQLHSDLQEDWDLYVKHGGRGKGTLHDQTFVMPKDGGDTPVDLVKNRWPESSADEDVDDETTAPDTRTVSRFEKSKDGDIQPKHMIAFMSTVVALLVTAAFAIKNAPNNGPTNEANRTKAQQKAPNTRAFIDR